MRFLYAYMILSLSLVVFAASEPMEGADKDALFAHAFSISGKDDNAAFESFKKAAELGHLQAYFFVGASYLNEKGVEKDPKLALEWLTKGALKRESNCMILLGACYLKGEDVGKDPAKAFAWATFAGLSMHPQGRVLQDIILDSLSGDEREKLEKERSQLNAGKMDENNELARNVAEIASQMSEPTDDSWLKQPHYMILPQNKRAPKGRRAIDVEPKQN